VIAGVAQVIAPVRLQSLRHDVWNRRASGTAEV